jgi:hypothetical protein
MATSILLIKVGFGDIFPNSSLGHITSLVAAVLGMLIIALFVVSVQNFTSMDK